MQGFGFYERKIEPHPRFLLRGQFSVKKKVQKGGYFPFQFLSDFGICFSQRREFSHPVTRFSRLYQNGIEFVVGTEQKLAEKRGLYTVFSLGFTFELKSGTQVFQSFAVLLFVKQHFFYADKQFVCPIGIELASEIFVGVEGHVFPENIFQQIQKSRFSGVSLFGQQQNNGEFLNRMQVQQLNVIQSQFVLLAENVPDDGQNGLAFARFRRMLKRFVQVETSADSLLPTGVRRHDAEVVVFGNCADKILSVVLSNGFDAPRHAYTRHFARK